MGDVVNASDSGFEEHINQDFTLSTSLLIFQPENKSLLDAYYKAIGNGIIGWDGETRSEYKYGFLLNRVVFNNYLLKVYPESIYCVRYQKMATAKKLYAEYDANEVSADDLYKNKLILVEGSVKTIAKDFTDKPYIVFSTGYFGEVICYFDSEDQLRTLSKGDHLLVTGICTGRLLNSVRLKSCKIF
jgi:hypothetical protein